MITHGILRGRNRLALLIATALLCIGATAGTASATTTSFSNSTPIAIPNSGPAPPYPSSIAVSGFAGPVQKATVTLRGLTHTHPDDIAVLLVGPSGANSILMGRSGGSTDVSGVNLTFDQAAASAVPDVLVSGAYRPTSEANHTLNPLSPPAPGFPYPVDLNQFNGTSANGTWSLFVDDQAGGDEGTISGGWSLALTAPVNTVTVGTPSLNKKNGTAQVPVTVGDAGQLTLSGQGVATVASAGADKSVAVSGPGTTFLTVRATGKKKKKLNTKSKVNVSPTITFTPTGGTPRSTPLTVKLKKKVKKHKK